LPGTNTLAYYEQSSIAAVKSFIGFSPAVSCLLELCLISWQICFFYDLTNFLDETETFLTENNEFDMNQGRHRRPQKSLLQDLRK
jgi:hypothetical protein